MKVTLKRLFCLLMALTMVFCLAACGSDSEDAGNTKKGKKTLVGDWEAEIDMSDFINDMMEEQMEMDLDVEGFVMTMALTFNEDGTFETKIEADFDKAMEKLLDSVWDYAVETAAAESGISASEMEELLEEQGYTKDALLEELDIEDMIGDLNEEITGEWVLDGDQLYMDETNPKDSEPVTIELDVDEFSITEMDDDGTGYAELLLPLVFERV